MWKLRKAMHWCTLHICLAYLSTPQTVRIYAPNNKFANLHDGKQHTGATGITHLLLQKMIKSHVLVCHGIFARYMYSILGFQTTSQPNYLDKSRTFKKA